jgi:hypothetical protein
LYKRYKDKLRGTCYVRINRVARDEWVKWESLPHRTDIRKKWICKVRDYDRQKYKYNWKQSFLSRSYIDNELCFNFIIAHRGDLIRKGEGSRKTPTCFLILKKDVNGVSMAEVSESDALDILSDDAGCSSQGGGI